jgi:hypothetical protein
MNESCQLAKSAPEAPYAMDWQPAGQPHRNAPILFDSTHHRDLIATGQRLFSPIETAATNPVENETQACGAEHA